MSYEQIDPLDKVLRGMARHIQIPDEIAVQARHDYEQLAFELQSGPLRVWAPDVYPQGSVGLGTTVRPLRREEFDIDLILECKVVELPPEVVFEAVAAAIESSPSFGARVERLDRCVRIKLGGKYHLDVVPATRQVPDSTAILIPDRCDGGWRWKGTNPKGYRTWFESKCVVPSVALAKMTEPLPVEAPADRKPPLKIAIQLLKRHHIAHVLDEVRTPSIVITTLSAMGGSGADVESTLDRAIAYLDLVASSDVPQAIMNPAHPSEVITEKWQEEGSYRQFKSWVKEVKANWESVKKSKGSGVNALGASLEAMFDATTTKAGFDSFGRDLRNLSLSGQLVAKPAGALTVVAAGAGAPRKEFYGRAPKN